MYNMTEQDPPRPFWTRGRRNFGSGVMTGLLLVLLCYWALPAFWAAITDYRYYAGYKDGAIKGAIIGAEQQRRVGVSVRCGP